MNEKCVNRPKKHSEFDENEHVYPTEGYQRYYHYVNKSPPNDTDIPKPDNDSNQIQISSVSPQDSDIQYVICNAKLEQ